MQAEVREKVKHCQALAAELGLSQTDCRNHQRDIAGLQDQMQLLKVEGTALVSSPAHYMLISQALTCELLHISSLMSQSESEGEGCARLTVHGAERVYAAGQVL